MEEQNRAKELNALIEELTDMLLLNLFKGDVPMDGKKQALKILENSTERKWGWDFTSILDEYLYGIEIWDSLGSEGRKAVAKAIINYLKEEE